MGNRRWRQGVRVLALTVSIVEAALLLDDEHVAARGAGQVVRRAAPKMLVYPGMSREADDQQIDGILAGRNRQLP